MVTTTTPGGQRVPKCTCTRTGRHLATFTRRPGSSLYTLATEPPQIAASAQFDTWLDDMQQYLLSDSRDSVSLFDHTSGAAPAPPATADSATRSQWLTHDAATRLAIRNHLPLAECAHFGQHRTVQALYDAEVAHYSSPAIAALGCLLLPYLFPKLSAFDTVDDLVSHLRTSDARYRAALPAEFLDRIPPPMYITLYFIVNRLPDSLCTVRDHFLALDPTALTVDLLEQHLLAAETSVVDVGAARGTPRTPFFEGCPPSPLAPSYASAVAADVLGAEDVGAASARGKHRTSKGKGGRGGGSGSGGGGGVSSGGHGGSGGGGDSGSGGGGGGFGGGGGGRGGGGGNGGSGSGGGQAGATQREGSCGSQRQQQQRRSKTPSPQQLREWFSQREASGGSGSRPYVIRTGNHAGQTCWKPHTQHRCFSHLDDAWRAEFGDEAERLRWAELLRSGVALFDLDYDAILAAMNALSVSAEGKCYPYVPLDRGIEAAALGAGESALPSTALAKALHTFTLDSGASRCFFSNSTTLTSLSAPEPIRLADPSEGPVLARSSTVLPCPAVPSGSLSGLQLPSFSTNLASTAALHDAMVTTTTLGGQRVLICTCTRTGRHLATFTHRPGSSLYTRATEPPQLALSAQVSASGLVAPPCSCRLLSHQTLLWHHRLGHPSLPRLCGMHSRLLVYGLPSPSPAPRAVPCGPFVMEVARTSMIHAAAPHFLWWFAVRYATHQLNLWPRVSLLDTSHTLRWTGKVGDASVFRVWGSRAFVRDSSADKLSARAMRCVFLGFSPNAPGWQFYHPTSHRVFPSQDVTFDESIPFYRLFPYRSAPPPPPPLFLAPGAARGAASGGLASGGADTRGAEPGDAEPGGAESEGAKSRGAEPGGVEPRGAKLAGVVPGGAGSGGAELREPLSSQQLREWFTQRTRLRSGATSDGDSATGDTRVGGAGVTAGAGGTGGVAAAGPGGPRTRGTGASGTGSVWGAGAGDSTGPGAARAGGTGAGGAGAVGARAGGTSAGGAGAGGAGAVDPIAGGGGAEVAVSGGLGAGGTVRPRPYFVPLLQQPASALPAPPYTEHIGGLTERRVPASCTASPVRTGCCVPRPRPPPIPGTHAMALRPSSVPLHVPLPARPESSLLAVPDTESDGTHAASPTVSRLLATHVTGPSFESTAAFALVAELVESAPPSDESEEPSGPYPELVGCLMYLMTCTRPDLAYPLSLLARYVALGRHRKVHWDAAKRVLCYLCSTSCMGLVLGGRGRVVLTGHIDASWPYCPTACNAPATTAASAASAATAATPANATMASPTILTFDAEGRAVDFDVWVDDLQLLLQCDSRDGVSLSDHTSGVSTAPAATADSTVRSQWTTRDAVARLAIRSHLPPAERANFGQYKTAKSLYNAISASQLEPRTEDKRVDRHETEPEPRLKV
ncbi:unnamed protein product [Closterium sp. NIES-54]